MYDARIPPLALALAIFGGCYRPETQRVRWPQLGHYPQVEDPQQVATSVEAFWDRVG